MTSAVTAPTTNLHPTGEAENTYHIDPSGLTEKEKKEFTASSDSLVSADGKASTLVDPFVTAFSPTQILHINAQGIRAFRPPFPSSELEIPIYNDTDGALAYMSTRARVRGGNAILSAPGRGDLVASEYRWGPGRDPVIKMLERKDGQRHIKVSGKWTSRDQMFTDSAVPIVFHWTYKKEVREVVGKDGTKTTKKLTVLVMEVHGAHGEKGNSDATRIAELTRGPEKRTPGSGYHNAGNGGELGIDETAAKGLGIPEELVVASCVMMLKKEIDRRRAIQAMAMSAAISGGS
jgi:hypothetical protein